MRKYKFQRTFVKDLADQIQMDLVDMGKYIGVRDLLTKNNIEYFSTNSERKAAIVERFNRTLKTSMWKYFYSKGTHTWIDVHT